MTTIPDSFHGWAKEFHEQTGVLLSRAQFRENVGLDNRDLHREIETRQEALERFIRAYKEEGWIDD